MHLIVLIRQLQAGCRSPGRDSTVERVGAYLINYAFDLAAARAALIKIIQYLICVAHARRPRLATSRWTVRRAAGALCKCVSRRMERIDQPSISAPPRSIANVPRRFAPWTVELRP